MNRLSGEWNRRKYWILGWMAFVLLVFILRLFYLQIISSDYKEKADSNAFLVKTLYPSRGMMYDRNGTLLVYNQPAYDIVMVKRETQPFDTLDFCASIDIDIAHFRKRMSEVTNRVINPGYSWFTPQPFIAQLSQQEYGRLQEKMYKFPGFYIQKRTIREYMTHSAGHLLGSVGEVSKRDLTKDAYYKQGDYIGKSGIEKSYESILRGIKGKEVLLRDAHGVIKGRMNEGMQDEASISGSNITLSIDIGLQELAEELMANKLGSIVAIEPKTGEVLVMVSAPSYDPSLLVGRSRGKNHRELENNPLKPLFDRPLMATYPPGSTFKTTQGLIFQQEKAITAQSSYPCALGFVYGNRRLGCHPHGSPLSLVPAIQTSCNAYFCYGLRAMLENRTRYHSIQEAFDVWKDHLVSMGFGYPLGIDLPGEKRGLIPNSKFYDTIYGSRGWRAATIISIAIGQGEVLSTPLQIANLAAQIANRGCFYTPHVVKSIENGALDTLYTKRRYTTINPSFYEPIIQGMELAVSSGTATGARLTDIAVCGKTGTAQNPHGRDHSIFMGFAPKEQPKIAISVYVENAGFGATMAVPIAQLILERYLNGSLSEWSQAKVEQIKNTKILPYGIYR